MGGIESLWQSLRYRGGVGQWAWLLHRLAGVGILLFLILHILDIFLVAFGPETFEKLLFIYHSVVFRPLLVLLTFGVVYHALNGLRIVIIEFWPAATVHHKPLWYGAISISLGLTFISILVMF